MKYLFVSALVALLLVLLLRRLRPYLRLVQEFINILRRVRGVTGANPRVQQAEKLVCCETCGTWVPIGRALTAGSKGVFCSTNCLNAKPSRKQRA